MAGRRRPGAAHEEHADERWLLTYADMITLLMALFMVLFSMSIVNKSKLASLQESLHNAFSPHVVPGGQAIKRTGGDAQTQQLKPQSSPNTARADAKAAEDRELRRLKHEVDERAQKLGMNDKVKTHVTRRGLVIDILTDNLLFDSGAARIQPAGMDLLAHLAPLLRHQRSHQVDVEGHTDSQPIHGSVYPSNWELSTARASAVVRALIAMRMTPGRLTATGRAYLDPSASNATSQGRARNRRVEIVLPRRGA
ncbi:MAG TPA: flagellar motor protein MotB [Solirubrobacteraceae bacterium]|jgi:chemotaxis protein MotB